MMGEGLRPESVRDLETLKAFLRTYFRGRPVKVILFGSRARGDASPDSDVDLAFVSDHDLREDLAMLGALLDGSNLPWKVDLVELSRAPRALQQRVLKEGVVWIE